jgi:hypothetical protein
MRTASALMVKTINREQQTNGHRQVSVCVRQFKGWPNFLFLTQPKESASVVPEVDQTMSSSVENKELDVIPADLFNVHDFDVSIDLQAAGKVSQEVLATYSVFLSTAYSVLV